MTLKKRQRKKWNDKFKNMDRIRSPLDQQNWLVEILTKIEKWNELKDLCKELKDLWMHNTIKLQFGETRTFNFQAILMTLSFSCSTVAQYRNKK